MDMAIADVSQQRFKPSIALAIILIVLGVLAITLPIATSVGVVTILAWLLIIDGIAQFIFAFRTEGVGRTVWKVLVAILYFGGGIYLLARPLVGLAGLTFLMALFFVAEGVMDLFAYIVASGWMRSPWLLVHGIVSLALGFIIWSRWPLSSFWVIGSFVGISMVLTGITRLMMAIEARRVDAARVSVEDRRAA
jgi:uncharacterized membrane protein HdeD (DUF308 family)